MIVNLEWGDSMCFDSVEDMAQAIIACGYEIPEGGLVEGVDYCTVFYREENNARLFWKTGEVVNRLDVDNLYSVDGISTYCDHPDGIVITVDQAIKLGIEKE